MITPIRAQRCLRNIRPQKLSRGKSDPQNQTDYMPYKIFCVTHCVDQIQAFLKNYSECLYIIGLVSVDNFYIDR